MARTHRIGQLAPTVPAQTSPLHLEQQHRILDTALSSMSDFAYMYDRDGRFLYANRALLDAMGVSLDAIIGKSYKDLGLADHLAQRLADQLHQVLTTGLPVKDQGVMRRASGAVTEHEYIFQPVFAADGSVELIAGSSRDVTERNRAATALADSERRFRFLSALSDATRGLVEPMQVMEVVTRLLGQHLGASRCAYGGVDLAADSCSVLHDYTDGCSSVVGTYRFSAFGSLTAETLLSGRTLVVNDVDAMPNEADGAAGFRGIGVRALMVCPLVHAGSLQAFLAVHQTQPRVWRAAEIALIEEVSVRCWATIEQVRAHARLRESDRELSMLAESMPQMVWTADGKGEITYLNERWVHYTGLSREGSYGLRWTQSIFPEDWPETTAEWGRAAKAGVTFEHEFRLRRMDGAYRWFLARGVPILGENGRIQKWFGTSTDIDDKKQLEQEMRCHAKQQSLIAEFGRQALASSELGALFNFAAHAAVEGLPQVCCKFVQLGADKKSLLCRAGVGWQGRWAGTHELDTRGQERLLQVIETGEPECIADFDNQTRHARSEMLEVHAIRSSVEVAVAGASGVCGVLGVYAQRPEAFTAKNVHFIQSLAHTLATAMDRKTADERLAYLAQFDTLTGLPNRHLVIDRLVQTLSLAQRNEQRAAAVVIDLDHFKAINDTLGHAVGDQLLVQVAERLKGCVRGSDTVARLGADEFAFVLSNLSRPEDAVLVAQKVVAALALPFTLAEGNEVYVSASLGLATFPEDAQSAADLLKNADAAMWRAKERGRNTYQLYLPQMNELALERLTLETQLRGALEREEFVLHYQPKLNLASGEISGFEALLRWQHPQRGLVPPLKFISILEETGLIIRVGEWVVRAAIDQLLRWKAEGVPLRPIAVNVSARQFQQRDFDAIIGAILAETGIDACWLEFELTESMLMNDPEEAVRILNSMRAMGVRLSVDDFGTGYSSLSYLKRFPLDALKIDRAFMRDVTTDADDATIAQAIIGLAHNLKLKVVAEGVETQAQLDFLRLHGCDEMQGYFFSRPVPAEDSTRLLVEGKRLENSQPKDIAEA